MAITVVRYSTADTTGWAVLRDNKITPIPGNFQATGELLTGMTTAELAALDGDVIDVDAVRLLSPITRNQQFVCQGANYRQHMIESGLDPDAKSYNMIFTKARSSIAPADTDVIRPRQVKFLDYEIELGLVLRREITGPVQVTEENLHEFVAGAVIVNDYSARDVQLPQTQFYKGKSFRTFGPVGPYLVLFETDEIGLLHSLDLRLTVNSEVRQQDSTANLVFKPTETLTELSTVQNFWPGDLLSTGTPAGCALGVPDPRLVKIVGLLPERKKWQLFERTQSKRPYLQPGDVVEATITSQDGRIDLGRQRNHVVAEVGAPEGSA
jgi:2-keto-4-pentenoate hydratase/2-oxohepta-3-ene-1,7-dioic acid hydratase in catechol pathway